MIRALSSVAAIRFAKDLVAAYVIVGVTNVAWCQSPDRWRVQLVVMDSPEVAWLSWAVKVRLNTTPGIALVEDTDAPRLEVHLSVIGVVPEREPDVAAYSAVVLLA